MKLLFLCSQNVLRSPTAEAVFSVWPGIEASSAGTDAEAEMPVSADLIEWAEVVLVMETHHRRKIEARFPELLREKRVVVLGIPDNYEYMDPELVELLKTKVTQSLKIERA